MKVIGLTGTIGSGKSIVKEFLMHDYSCYHVALSDVIRGELEKRRPGFNRKTLQDMGNEMRRLYGGHILAKMAVEYLPRDKEMIIVDGIRNPGEVEFLRRQFGVNFVLVAVDAPAEKRFENISRRNDPRDPRTREEFDAMDARDQGAGEPPYGQQVAACMQIADHKILNDGTLEDLHNKLREVMKKIV